MLKFQEPSGFQGNEFSGNEIGLQVSIKRLKSFPEAIDGYFPTEPSETKLLHDENLFLISLD